MWLNREVAVKSVKQLHILPKIVLKRTVASLQEMLG